MNKVQKRNPPNSLQHTLSTAKEYLEKLSVLLERQNELKRKYTTSFDLSDEEDKEYQDLPVYLRAIKTALIMDIGKIFDTYDGASEVISFKKTDFFKEIQSIKDEIDSIHGEAIICKILDTRDTWSAHIGEELNDIISTEEICVSKLSQLMERLDTLLTEYILWFNQKTR